MLRPPRVGGTAAPRIQHAERPRQRSAPKEPPRFAFQPPAHSCATTPTRAAQQAVDHALPTRYPAASVLSAAQRPSNSPTCSPPAPPATRSTCTVPSRRAHLTSFGPRCRAAYCRRLCASFARDLRAPMCAVRGGRLVPVCFGREARLSHPARGARQTRSKTRYCLISVRRTQPTPTSTTAARPTALSFATWTTPCRRRTSCPSLARCDCSPDCHTRLSGAIAQITTRWGTTGANFPLWHASGAVRPDPEVSPIAEHPPVAWPNSCCRCMTIHT
mmetsp:Transcript_82030/g.245938  ORF Transcript_82030/g.245938 Transcript_82030/m.245938 type:complete len:274 (-) Transcript_82030:508-1329(-)